MKTLDADAIMARATPVAGATFMQLHLLFDKHAGEQTELVDALAERIQTLGGVCLAMAPDVAETTLIPRPPKGREEAPIQIARLLHAHEIVIKEARAMARRAAESGDDGTNDLLVSDLIRQNEQQTWFLGFGLAAAKNAPRQPYTLTTSFVSHGRDPVGVL